MSKSLPGGTHDGERARARPGGDSEGEAARNLCPGKAGGGAAHRRGKGGGTPSSCSSQAQPVGATERQRQEWRRGCSWTRAAANQRGWKAQGRRLGCAAAAQQVAGGEEGLSAERRGELGGAGRRRGDYWLPGAHGSAVRARYDGGNARARGGSARLDEGELEKKAVRYVRRRGAYRIPVFGATVILTQPGGGLGNEMNVVLHAFLRAMLSRKRLLVASTRVMHYFV